MLRANTPEIPKPDEGGPADAGALAALKKRYDALENKTWLHAMCRDARGVGCSLSMAESQKPSVRRFEIFRALVRYVEFCSGSDDRIAQEGIFRAILVLVLGDDAVQPAFTTARLVASLTIEEARRIALAIDGLEGEGDELSISYADDQWRVFAA